MKHPLSFCKLVMAAAVALPTMALATITPEAPTLDNTDNCYMIGSAAELYGFAEMVNGTGGGFDGCGKLTADIVVNKNVLGTDNANVNASGAYTGDDSNFDKWAPINGFAGKFHGQGHTISGLYFNDPVKEKVGLFGNADDVEIDGLGLVDSYFEGSSNVGGFVGYAGGSVYIRNSYNSSVVRGDFNSFWCSVGGFVGAADVDELEIENSYNLGFVTGGPAVGGLVGKIWVSENFSVSNSYNAGDVKGTSDVVGGLVGYFVSDDVVAGIVSSYNTGSVYGGVGVGGLVGYLDDCEIRIVNSYNTGTVDGDNAGGLIAVDGWGYANVYNSYNAGLVNGGNGDALGLYYEVDNFYYLEGSSGGDLSYIGTTKEKLENGTVAEALHGYNENGVNGSVWGQGFGRDALPTLTGAIGPALTLHVYEGVEIDSAYTPDTDLPKPTREGYEFLGWYADAGFSGSVVTKIPANATGKLEYYAKWMKFSDNCYEIASAEDLYDFAAIVNGGAGEICGKLTDNISVNENVLTSDGVLNVDLEDDFAPWTPIGTSGAQFKGTFDGQGHTISGLYFKDDNANDVGLFGYVGKASIQNVGVVDSYFKGWQHVGGVVGEMSGSITNCYNKGVVSGTKYVGGVLGMLNEGFISNVYNVGSVSGNEFVGGVVGNVESENTVSNVYNIGSVSGSKRVGGVAGACADEVSVNNAFYNKDAFTEDAIGESCEGNFDNVEGRTASEFADGTVALLLHNWCEMDGGVCKADGLDGSIWGQNVGQASDNDAAPTLSGVLKLGPLTVAKDAAGKETVAIDGNSALEVKIPADIHVDYVKFNRTFTQGIVATIVLPFDVPSSALPGNVEFGTLKSVGPNPENGGKWEAVFTTVTELDAHTPYLVRLTSGTSLDFKFGEAGVTIKATEEYDEVSGKMVTVPTSSTSTDEQWKLVGTYSYKSWQDGDLGIGSTYGFAGSAEGENVVAGQFVKVGAGAYINPMRVYLQKVTKDNPSPRPSYKASVLASIPEELPESIDVVFVDSDDAADANEVAAGSDSAAEKTTYIGRINTRTGAIELKRTYDAKGRMLNSKPTAKGNYFNKKVIK